GPGSPPLALTQGWPHGSETFGLGPCDEPLGIRASAQEREKKTALPMAMIRERVKDPRILTSERRWGFLLLPISPDSKNRGNKFHSGRNKQQAFSFFFSPFLPPPKEPRCQEGNRYQLWYY